MVQCERPDKKLLPSQAECHQYHTISAYVITLSATLSQMHVRKLCMPPGLEVYFRWKSSSRQTIQVDLLMLLLTFWIRNRAGLHSEGCFGVDNLSAAITR